MITIGWNGATTLVLSRQSVKIGRIFDSFYELIEPATGLPTWELRWHQTGFELWLGRHHLTIELPPLAHALRRLAARIAAAEVSQASAKAAALSPDAPGFEWSGYGTA